MPATLPGLPSRTLELRLRATSRWLVPASIAGLLIGMAVIVGMHTMGRPDASSSEPPLTAPQRANQQQCAEGALLLHDVRWAASCKDLADQGRGDGYAECELPDPEAARLYNLLRHAEQQCLAEARALGNAG